MKNQVNDLKNQGIDLKNQVNDLKNQGIDLKNELNKKFDLILQKLKIVDEWLDL